MVTLVVKDVAEKAGIKTAYELAQRTRIPVRSVYRIWDGSAKMIGLETIDRLCEVLDVGPGHLFKRVAKEA